MDLNFSLTELNKKSPYMLESTGMYSFTFITEQGKKYEIGFIQDLMLVPIWMRKLLSPIILRKGNETETLDKQ